MSRIPREVIEHKLKVHVDVGPFHQKLRKQSMKRQNFNREEVQKLFHASFLRKVHHPKWLANPVVVPKPDCKLWMYVDYTNLNKACSKGLIPSLA
jgi:hypothetical protein